LRYRLGCPECAAVLVVEYDLPGMRAAGLPACDHPGIWRFAPLLPIADPDHFTSLGEGGTPLLPAPRLGARLGLRDLWLKCEGANPTGSMKDRSSATAVAAARQFGFDRIAVVSSGNTGASAASYAARAGLRCFVFAAEYASPAQRQQILAATPDLHVYRGAYEDMAAAVGRVAREQAVFDGGSSPNPFNAEGLKTLAFEVYEELGRQAPDYVVYPVGAGDLLLAGQRGFAQLREAGLADHVPAPVAAQSDAADTLVQALRSGGALTPREPGRTVAGGVVVGDMGRKGELALRVLRQQQGLGASASDAEILEWQRRLARLEGIWAGPTACVVLPALAKLAAEGSVPPDARVVCVISESGLKGDAPAQPTPSIEPTETAVRSALAG
jgi:threonine synthase